MSKVTSLCINFNKNEGVTFNVVYRTYEDHWAACWPKTQLLTLVYPQNGADLRILNFCTGKEKDKQITSLNNQIQYYNPLQYSPSIIQPFSIIGFNIVTG